MNLPLNKSEPLRVFLDSAGFLALINPYDLHHAEAVSVWNRLTEEHWRAFTTNFVIAETQALLLARVGRGNATAFLQQIGQSSTTIVRATARDEERARAIILEWEDASFSLTNALSFAVMERLRIGAAFTFDRSFARYGFRMLGPPASA